jgi:hypothetical protein
MCDNHLFNLLLRSKLRSISSTKISVFFNTSFVHGRLQTCRDTHRSPMEMGVWLIVVKSSTLGLISIPRHSISFYPQVVQGSCGDKAKFSFSFSYHTALSECRSSLIRACMEHLKPKAYAMNQHKNKCVQLTLQNFFHLSQIIF